MKKNLTALVSATILIVGLLTVTMVKPVRAALADWTSPTAGFTGYTTSNNEPGGNAYTEAPGHPDADKFVSVRFKITKTGYTPYYSSLVQGNIFVETGYVHASFSKSNAHYHTYHIAHKYPSNATWNTELEGDY